MNPITTTRRSFVSALCSIPLLGLLISQLRSAPITMKRTLGRRTIDLGLQTVSLDQIDIDNKHNCRDEIPTLYRAVMVNSVREYGIKDPILVVRKRRPFREDRVTMLGGLLRYQAAKELEYKVIPCIVLSENKWKFKYYSCSERNEFTTWLSYTT